MDASSFKKINFGESSAEKEKAHSPNLLLEGFLDERGDINEVIAGARFLIYGQKGSGKSAICSRVELIADSRNLSVKTYTLERLNYNAFEGMDTKKEAPEIKNTRSWEMVLHTALLGMYSNPDAVSLALLQYYDYENLKDIGSALSKNEKNPPVLADITPYNILNYKEWPHIAKITGDTPLAWYNKVPLVHEMQSLDNKIGRAHV